MSGYSKSAIASSLSAGTCAAYFHPLLTCSNAHLLTHPLIKVRRMYISIFCEVMTWWFMMIPWIFLAHQSIINVYPSIQTANQPARRWLVRILLSLQWFTGPSVKMIVSYKPFPFLPRKRSLFQFYGGNPIEPFVTLEAGKVMHHLTRKKSISNEHKAMSSFTIPCLLKWSSLLWV